ncbi:MAG: hypothetical protein K0U36_05490 [Alphaproteobacteria bacterium]|nr:hypothetical protein [Alphaproteobacteria bacterium]
MTPPQGIDSDTTDSISGFANSPRGSYYAVAIRDFSVTFFTPSPCTDSIVALMVPLH